MGGNTVQDDESSHYAEFHCTFDRISLPESQVDDRVLVGCELPRLVPSRPPLGRCFGGESALVGWQ